MVVAATLDRMTTLNATERYGVVTHLVRQAQITGLDDTGTANYKRLFVALDNVGLTKGSDLEDDTGQQTNLVLTERNPSIDPRDPEVIQVELVYEHFLNDGQPFTDNPFGSLTISSQSSLQQITVNKYPADYPTEALRNKAIEVKHTFPDGSDTYKDNDGVKLPVDEDYPGVTVVQGGTIESFDPQEVIVAEGIVKFPYKGYAHPYNLRDAILRHVNSAEWAGKPVRTWLCMSANYEWYDQGAGFLIKMHFEFQYRKTTWDPDAVFIDPRTNKVPPNLQAQGYTTVTDLPEVDFNTIIDAEG